MAGKGTKNNQQNTQGDAQTEQAVQTKPLDFDVRIHSIKPNESIKGTASVNINGAFAIRGVKIIEGSNGLFVSMPSYKVENMEQHVPFKVTITEHNPERGVLANADVNVAGIMTIRNVKIKQDDYGLTVTMPRTKMPHTEQYKDSVYFADKSMKQQFDMAVETAYQESVLTPVLDQNEPEEGMEQEETTGMSMGM